MTVLSTRERAEYIFNNLSEEQLAAFVTLFGSNFIFEEKPDEWDKQMIERSIHDTSESVPLEQAAFEMGIDLNYI